MIQSGPPRMRSGTNAGMSAIPYAAAMRFFNATFLTTRRPPGCTPNERRSSDVFCLTDATSKIGRGSEAWTCARSAIGADGRERKSARFIEMLLASAVAEQRWEHENHERRPGGEHGQVRNLPPLQRGKRAPVAQEARVPPR